MSRTDIHYPYPILINDGDDYINSNFSVNIESNLEKKLGKLKITFSYALKSDGLNSMLENEDIDIFVQIVSKLTSYREVKRFHGSKTLTIIIDASLVSKELVFTPFIATLKKIDNFHLNEHNSIFSNTKFTLNKGDKIAFTDSISYSLPTVDPLRPTSSVVRIKLNEQKNAAPYELNLDTNKIIIYLNEKSFNLYKNLRLDSGINTFLSPIIMLPAIVEALSYLQHDEDNTYSQLTWGTVLSGVLQKKNIDLNNTNKSLVTIANDIFNDGFTFALENLKDFYEKETEVE